MRHDRSLRAPVWKAIFEVFAVSLIPTVIANRAEPKYVPWWLVVVCLAVALFAMAMWMHDAGYATFVSSRIDGSRARKAEAIKATTEAWVHQLMVAMNSMWTTSCKMTFWNQGYTVGVWAHAPAASQGQSIGVVNAICRVRHVGHGDYRASQGTPNGDMGLSLAFPQEFQQLDNSSALGWPLPEGEYQVDWTGLPGYATRQRFSIDNHGRFA
jgi:hypothetical protein